MGKKSETNLGVKSQGFVYLSCGKENGEMEETRGDTATGVVVRNRKPQAHVSASLEFRNGNRHNGYWKEDGNRLLLRRLGPPSG